MDFKPKEIVSDPNVDMEIMKIMEEEEKRRALAELKKRMFQQGPIPPVKIPTNVDIGIAYEEAIAKFNKIQTAHIYNRLEGEVAVLQVPAFQCPECLYELQVTITPDRLRISIKHHEHARCSRSMTEVIRTVGEFIKFI